MRCYICSVQIKKYIFLKTLMCKNVNDGLQVHLLRITWGYFQFFSIQNVLCVGLSDISLTTD